MNAKLIIAIISLTITIGGILAAVMATIYCTKTELLNTKEALATSITDVKLAASKAQGADQVRDWKIQTIQTQVQNIEVRQIQTNDNIRKLLVRFRVEPVAKPKFKPLPDPPREAANELSSTEGR